MTEPSFPLLAVVGLGKTYRLRAGLLARLTGGATSIDALDDVTLAIREGEILGVVGESGSGKSTLGRVLVRLLPQSRGTLAYRGEPVPAVGSRALRAYRRRIQMVFQDSGSALNPRKRVRRILDEALAAAGVPRRDRPGRLAELLEEVGLPAGMLERHPHALSGGQRQRVNIARALAMRPEILVADEPVSALDVSLQGQIVNLLTRLAREQGLTLVLISHDLAVVRRICSRVVVMQAGRIVEEGDPETLMSTPRHPYTARLVAAVPRGLAGRVDRHAGPVGSDTA